MSLVSYKTKENGNEHQENNMLRQISYSSSSTSTVNHQNEALKDHANSMRLSSARSSDAEICIGKIVNVLKTNCNEYRIDVGRVKVVSSFMKKTYTDGSDIDLVVFINNAYPPFDDILSKLKSILRSKLGIWATCKKNLISFNMDTFKFDILPATNFDGGLQSQIVGALKYFKQNAVNAKNVSHLYGPGWSEYATNFVGKNSQFVLDVIMLARQWIKGIKFGHKHIPSLSYMVELIVVFANREKDDSCLQTGFVRFLELMAKFNKIDIDFNDYKWVHQSIGITRFSRSLPRILDPINVWHNLAEKFYDVNQLRVMKAAELTLEQLRNGAELIELLESQS